MDAPPPQEDCRPFVRIASCLEDIGLNSVRVLEADVERGYLLLSDFGSMQYLTALEAAPQRATSLYKDAIDALLQMQVGGSKFESELPIYTPARMHMEMSLFRDWLCGQHLKLEFSKREEKLWQAGCNFLVENALAQSQVLVHRDYHSRNLMVMESCNPGILDFQDALVGPLTYDAVSLLKDCYIKWPAVQINELALYFHAHSSQAAQLSAEDFLRDFDLVGIQRHLKASGIFARLLHRDGKDGYLKDVPRTLSYVVDVAPDYAALEFLGEFVATQVLPALNETLE